MAEDTKTLNDDVEAALEQAQTILDSGYTGTQDTIMTSEQKQGVLQTLIHAILSDEKKQYRQSLLTAAFDDKREAMLCADALSERHRYGVSIDSIVDRVIAQCAVKGQRSRDVMEAITHFTFSTNNPYYKPGGKKKFDKSKPL